METSARARTGIEVLGPIAMIVFGLALAFTPLASVSSAGSVGNAGAIGKPSTTDETTTTTTVAQDTTTTSVANDTTSTSTTTSTTTAVDDGTTTTSVVTPTPTTEVDVTTTIADAVAPVVTDPATSELPATGSSRSSLLVTGLGLAFVAGGIALLAFGRRPSRP